MAAFAALAAAGAGCSSGETVHLAASATTESTGEPTVTTEPPPTTATTTTEVGSTTTTANPIPAPTTAKPTTTVVRTTTTAAPGHAWTLSPTSGGQSTAVTASGGGCTGPQAGVSVAVFDPSGQGINGSGGAAQQDGSWNVPMNFYARPGEPAGRYKFVPSCVNGGATVFTYAPRYFTFTG
jgi:hypothetical protein